MGKKQSKVNQKVAALSKASQSGGNKEKRVALKGNPRTRGETGQTRAGPKRGTPKEKPKRASLLGPRPKK